MEKLRGRRWLMYVTGTVAHAAEVMILTQFAMIIMWLSINNAQPTYIIGMHIWLGDKITVTPLPALQLILSNASLLELETYKRYEINLAAWLNLCVDIYYRAGGTYLYRRA